MHVLSVDLEPEELQEAVDLIEEGGALVSEFTLMQTLVKILGRDLRTDEIRQYITQWNIKSESLKTPPADDHIKGGRTVVYAPSGPCPVDPPTTINGGTVMHWIWRLSQKFAEKNCILTRSAVACFLSHHRWNNEDERRHISQIIAESARLIFNDDGSVRYSFDYRFKS